MPDRALSISSGDALIYAGETVEITVSGFDYDGVTPLTPTVIGQTGTVTVSVIDASPAGTVWLTNQAMTWDSTNSQWKYLWNTGTGTPAPSNTYYVKVTVTDSTGAVAFSYDKLFLRPPVF